MTLELSSNGVHVMPLDYSNGSGNREQSPGVVPDSGSASPAGSSAFRVVTPKGRDGKT